MELFLRPIETIWWRKKWGLRAPLIPLSKILNKSHFYYIKSRGPLTPIFFFTKWFLWVIGTTLGAYFSSSITFDKIEFWWRVCDVIITWSGNAMHHKETFTSTLTQSESFCATQWTAVWSKSTIFPQEIANFQMPIGRLLHTYNGSMLWNLLKRKFWS